MQRLTPDESTAHLAALDGWQIEQGTVLVKVFAFKDFVTAINFMYQLAQTAEELNHHPDWANSYNKVTVRLTTHEASGLTAADFSFARAAETVATSLS